MLRGGGAHGGKKMVLEGRELVETQLCAIKIAGRDLE